MSRSPAQNSQKRQQPVAQVEAVPIKPGDAKSAWSPRYNPKFKEFHNRFPRLLKSWYSGQPLISAILTDKALTERCAILLWPCVDGSSAHFVAISKSWGRYWDAEIKTALAELDNVKAVENVYTNLDSRPDRVKVLAKMRSDLLNKQRIRREVQQPTLAFKRHLGRDQDWTIVRRTKEVLEALESMKPLLGGKPLPNATLAALLNGARAAAGLKERKYTAAAIRMNLKRHSARSEKRFTKLWSRKRGKRAIS